MTRRSLHLAIPPRDPAGLAGCPARALTPRRSLARMHRAGRSTCWFSTAGTGRFDLTDSRAAGGSALGSCYLADSPVTAVLEVFGGLRTVPTVDAATYVVSEVTPARRLLLADCTATTAAAVGVTGEIHTTVDYDRTQVWAAAFAAAGFDGVYYHPRHDPSQRSTAAALFGPAGAAEWPAPTSTTALTEQLLHEVSARYGIVFLDPDLQ